MQNPIFDLLSSINTLLRIAAVKRYIEPNGQAVGQLIDEAIEHLGEDRKPDVRKAIREWREFLTQVIDTPSDSPQTQHVFRIEDPDLKFLLSRILLDGSLRGAQVDPDATIRRSLLITAVSDFEVYLGRLAGAIMRKSPGILRAEDSSITLLELESLGSVEEARELITERKVDSLQQGSLDTWIDWFAKRKGKLESSINWNSIREVFARRHVMVHTGGRVNASYLKRCPEQQVKVGDIIEVDEDYLQESLNLLMTVALEVHFASALKFEDNKEAVRGDVGVFLGSLPRAGLNLTTQKFSKWCIENLGDDASRQILLELRVANWVARRDEGDKEAVIDEVRVFDISGLDHSYAYVKKILMGQVEEAAKLVAKALREGRLSTLELQTNPLFDREVKEAVQEITAHQ